MWPNPQVPADLVTFTEEILIEKLYFLYSAKLGGKRLFLLFLYDSQPIKLQDYFFRDL